VIITATGHRSNKMPCGYDETHPWAVETKKRLHRVLCDYGECVVRSGMALGWDQWVAEEVLLLPKLTLEAWIPCEDQFRMWPQHSRNRWAHILSQIPPENVHICWHGTYNENPQCMTDRNCAMLQDADLVLALWNRTPGGTGHCVYEAIKRGIEVKNLYFVM
jgi:uncharacterized phage-like protein YoqJ